MKQSPCHSCKNKDKCNYICVPWKKWFAEQWNKVVAPFRKERSNR